MEKAVILLVEDDAALREGMSDTLESEGYETVEAGNGLEGLEALERIFPDLIISDIMMPEMDGYTFHDRVVNDPKTATIPFIFLTAKSDQSDVLRGLRGGVDAYLTKPFDLEQLLAHVQNKLHRFAVVRKQAMVQLEELQHQIVNMFSHELRTPLTYITGYTDLLGSSPSISREELQLFLKGLRAGTDRLNRMVENILMLVHLSTNVYQEEYAAYAVVRADVGRFVQDSVNAYKDAAAAKGLGIEAEVEDSLPPVRHLETLLPRALNCLLDNAVKFSRTAGSQITVHAYESDGRVIIDVVDEGIGITPEDQDRIFEPFVQIDRVKYEQAGVGIGLTIARGLAEVHQGDVIVESQHGVGSKFSLWIPAAAATEEV